MIINLWITLFLMSSIAVGQPQRGQTSPATQPVSNELSIPDDALPVPTLGMTLAQLRTLLKEKEPAKLIPPNPGEIENDLTREANALKAEHRQVVFHQFTVLRAGQIIECVSPLTPGANHYFVFTDGRLTKITPSPAFSGKDIEIEANGVPAKAWVRDPVDPNKRLETVMSAESTRPEEFTGSMKRSIEAAIAARRRKMDPQPIPPEMIDALWEKAKVEFPQWRAEFLHRVEVATKYDPSQVRPGMSREDVAALFGSPKAMVPSHGDSVTCVYGEHVDAKLVSTPVPLWVAIAFEDGKVIAVWSHDFLNSTILPVPSQ